MEELKTLNWCIDGIAYRETINELLVNARDQLNPNKLRLVGMSSGDWHENNITINGIDHEDKPYSYAYIDLVFSGENDLVADAVMFLVHTTVYADYINPVYSSNIYENNQIVKKVAQKSILRKERSFNLVMSNTLLKLTGIDSFGTLDSRKQVALWFEEEYYKPFVKQAVKRFGEKVLERLDNHFKAALLLRLLGGSRISNMKPQDQVKIIGLIYKSIGTPIEGITNKAAINRFIEAL